MERLGRENSIELNVQTLYRNLISEDRIMPPYYNINKFVTLRPIILGNPMKDGTIPLLVCYHTATGIITVPHIGSEDNEYSGVEAAWNPSGRQLSPIWTGEFPYTPFRLRGVHSTASLPQEYAIPFVKEHLSLGHLNDPGEGDQTFLESIAEFNTVDETLRAVVSAQKNGSSVN